MLIEKIRNLSLKTKVLWILGFLILAITVISMIMDPPSESERKKGWETIPIDLPITVGKLDELGLALIGTHVGVKTFDGEAWESFTLGSPIQGSIRDLAIDSQGHVWILPYPGRTKLVIFDGEEWITYTDENTPLGEFDWLTSIAIDSTNRAWLSLRDQILIFDGSNWENLAYPQFGYGIHFLEIDKFDRVWIGRGHGVHVYDNGSWISFTPKNSEIIGDGIFSIYFDEDGNAWLGGKEGASFFDGKSWTNYRWGSNDYFDHVVAIEIDSSGRILFLSSSGLRMLDGEKWFFYNTYNSGFPVNGPDDKSIDLAIGPGGNIWITSPRVDGVTLATVDDAGLPFSISPGKEFFSKHNFSDWSNLSTPIIILALLSAWAAVYLENNIILFASAAAGLSLFIFAPYDSGRFFIVYILTGGIIGSLIGGIGKKRRIRTNILPTTIGFIIGALFGLGVLYLFAMYSYPA